MWPQTLSFRTGDDSFTILTRGKNITRALCSALQMVAARTPHAIVAAGLTKKKETRLGIVQRALAILAERLSAVALAGPPPTNSMPMPCS